MELRSHTKQKKDVAEICEIAEKAEMKFTLLGLGLYEEDMELKEMRQILQALQMSEEDIRNEWENDLTCGSADHVANSTMIESQNGTRVDSNSNSPIPHFEILTVHALVHHSFDWSPPRAKDNNGSTEDVEVSFLGRKRNLDPASLIEPKRLRQNSIENDFDSGVGLNNTASLDPLPFSESSGDDHHLNMPEKPSPAELGVGLNNAVSLDPLHFSEASGDDHHLNMPEKPSPAELGVGLNNAASLDPLPFSEASGDDHHLNMPDKPSPVELGVTNEELL